MRVINTTQNLNPIAETSINSGATSKDQKNKFIEDLTASKLKAGLEDFLKADSSGKVHEEQLQFALVNTMLTNKSIKLGDEFSKSFAKLSAAGGSIEDNVKLALADLVSQSKISQTEADSINGISFKAAQLDNNLTALYDNKGSEGDQTIAVATIDEALSKAASVIDSYRKGTTDIDSRPLTSPSNSISENSNQGTVTSSNEVSQTGNGQAVSSSRNGFLWKPVSDSNGKLVVLLPANLTGQVNGVEVHSSLPPSDTSKIESGKYSGNANGGRPHFRFSNPGSSFPDGAYVVARLNNGSYTTFQIGDSSARNN